ncbi:UDP-N-acetylmuramoyl-tripeptide--D-alanyl-D-alanine ligase [soil metagenome]
MNIEELYKLYTVNKSVSTDSRNITKGDIYFALKGYHFNGNKYASEALAKGADFAIVDEQQETTDTRLIYSENVLQTLQHLAGFHRSKFSIPIISITGSNGKTTTKELVHAVLATKYKTAVTFGNLNNHIGIPLTLLKIPADVEIVVIEMGANHRHEIEGYCSYTRPTHGLITNCGKAHLEGFGGVEGVIKGKGELFDFLRETNGTAFVNFDDEPVKQMGLQVHSFMSYGKIETGADVTGKVISSDPVLTVKIIEDVSKQIQTNLVGSYNLPNVLAAVAIGKYFNIDFQNSKHAIECYIPSNSRSQLLKKGTNTIILDAYNANPSSMKAAIQNFADMKAAKKILVLGSMMELGDESENEHQKLLELIAMYEWDDVLLVGDYFNFLQHSFNKFSTVQEAAAQIGESNLKNATVLIKGSRSMMMEKVLEAIPA